MLLKVGGVMLPLPGVRVGVMLRVPRPPLRATRLLPDVDAPLRGGVMLRLAGLLVKGGVRLRLPRTRSTSMVPLGGSGVREFWLDVIVWRVVCAWEG